MDWRSEGKELVEGGRKEANGSMELKDLNFRAVPSFKLAYT